MDVKNVTRNLALVRLTNNIENGIVRALCFYPEERNELSTYLLSPEPRSRRTVHFSLNYCYTTYNASNGITYDWRHCKYGVIIPLLSLIESGQKPLNIHPADTFFWEKVKLPQDTTIVEKPDLKYKVEETLRNRGLEVKRGDIRGWIDASTEERWAIEQIAERLGVTSAYHSETIYYRYEKLTGIVKNYWGAIDTWDDGSDSYYQSRYAELKSAAKELRLMLPELPFEEMKEYAQCILKEANDTFHRLED